MRGLLTAIVSMALVTLLIGVFFATRLVLYSERILPGVSSNGIDLGGKTLEEAAVRLTLELGAWQQHAIALRRGDTLWQFTPASLGIRLDPVASARRAFDVGRNGTVDALLADHLALLAGRQVSQPLYIFDQNTALPLLQQIAAQIDLPTIEAGVRLQGTEVIATAGQTGYMLNILFTLELIQQRIKEQSIEPIDLPIDARPPALTDASPYAEAARQRLRQSFMVSLPANLNSSEGPWNLTPASLAALLRFESIQQDARPALRIHLDETILAAWLASLGLDRIPENPRFIFNDETFQLDLMQSGSTGRSMDVNASMRAIQTAFENGLNQAELVFNILQPAVSDAASGAELGIRELVHAESSWFYGSTTARVNNIEIAASRFHGLLIPPGATFSMAESMGEISLDAGYSEALIIFDGQTIQGVGGGVCQVSTTLFRAAFFAGFPIVERYPHAYRVSYYEKTQGNQRNTRLAGLDATVYVPVVDFRFTNDTPYWLLMETYVSRPASRITWKFYSTSDGRSVEWETTGAYNTVEPPKPLYRVNNALEQGEIKQVDWEAQGAEVRVQRFVYRSGTLHIQDSFYTRYEPWRAVYEYGPGTEGIPESEGPAS